jgi:hypothetical protein
MPKNAVTEDAVKIAPPGPLANRFVRTLVGFGVGIGIGSAPFLGNLDVPGFSPLLSLFPESLKGFLLPTSAFLMGVIAAGTQFYSGFKLSAGASRRYAKYALAVILCSLFLLMFLHRRVVEVVHFSPQRKASYVIGAKRTETCPCNKTLSDAACIRNRNANPDNIEDCWQKNEVASREFALSAVYLVLTGSFAFFVGLLLLRESAISKERAETIRSQSKPKKTPQQNQGG